MVWHKYHTMAFLRHLRSQVVCSFSSLFVELKNWRYWNQRGIHQLIVWSTNDVTMKGFKLCIVHSCFWQWMPYSCVKQIFVPKFALLFSSNRRNFSICLKWCVKHLVCLLYAFYMHFLKMHAFLAKIHARLSKMHAFLKSAHKFLKRCKKMHINFNCFVCLFYQNQHNFLVASILTFLHWICFPG